MKKCVVIYNPKSGKKIKVDFLDKIKDILLEYKYNGDIILTKYRGHAKEIVTDLDNNVDLVISVGGDGTFNEVMSGNFKRKKRLLLAHIPLGTTNDIGVMYGYGKNILSNFRLLLKTGVVKKIDIPTINDQPFVYSACIGKFADIPYNTPRSLKEKYGYLAYIMYGIESLRKKSKLYNIKYIIDNKEYSGNYSFIIMSNANRIAGINNVYKDMKLDDDMFEVLLCSLDTKKKVINSLIDIATKGITNASGFTFHRTNNLIIKFESKNDMFWCVDGDSLEEYGREFNIVNHKNIKIMLPSKNVDKIFIR